MRPATLQPWSARGDAPALQRIASLVLAAAWHLALLFLLLHLAPPLVPPPLPKPVRVTIDLIPEGREAPERGRDVAAPSPQGGAARPAEPRPVPPVPPAAPPDASSSAIWSQVIPMTRQQLAAADIARMKSRPAAQAKDGASESGTSAGNDRGDTDGPGTGPNGEPLHNAQWYRRPTHAELATYLPQEKGQVGWGIIACQTMPGYRVDNCVEIAQSPAGSGLAGAVRQAAWQFRVLPPRIGGRSMVGAWVRIRIDYSESRAK